MLASLTAEEPRSSPGDLSLDLFLGCQFFLPMGQRPMAQHLGMCYSFRAMLRNGLGADILQGQCQSSDWRMPRSPSSQPHLTDLRVLSGEVQAQACSWLVLG